MQYLVKWKGYPDLDNQWVNKEDVFAEEVIREFENKTNSTTDPHKKGRKQSQNNIPHSSAKSSHTHSPSSAFHMSNYYNGSPTRIFAAELEEGLITPEQARAICAA